ncbi:MAG: UDP-N-acetylmuramoyl-L-alanine--D-glutamate ligase [Syntrophomonas sp.]
MDFNGEKILIVGMARSGLSAAKVLHKRGAIITVCDNKTPDKIGENYAELEEMGISLFAGTYPSVNKMDFDLLVVSPGVPLEIAPLREAFREGVPVIGEVELAYLLKSDRVEMYAITGTNGKTTTTALLQYILEADGRNSVSGGNIGVPLTNLVDNMNEGIISVEMSSFQLETCRTFKPHICGLLNITPDHLDRHKTMEAYIKAKAKIYACQDVNDYAVFNYEDENLRRLSADCISRVLYFSTERVLDKGAFVDQGIITVIIGDMPKMICPLEEVMLRGKHNLENILCAVLMAVVAGVDSEIIRQALRSFPGVRHRMEEVAVHEGILYINDSKATNPESVIKALESFSDPLILIAGGRNKGSSFSNLATVIQEKVKEIILLGEARQEIKCAVMDAGFKNIHEVRELSEAVVKAHGLAKSGDVVLLSPACASWDMFDNYEQRGDLFCTMVRSLIKG